MKEKNLKILTILNAIAFVIMVTVNALSSILHINGVLPEEVSDTYANLFAPAGITFTIWGAIYLALLLFVLYGLGLFKGKKGFSLESVKRIKYCFVISSVANAAWIFAWHNFKIGISLVLMLVIFVSLLLTFLRINKGELSNKEKLFVRIPFSLYFGWITIATIANVTTYLVSAGWNGFNLAESTWMIIIAIIGLLITGATILKFKNVAYGLVAIWAYSGILIKHLSESAFNGEYTGVIITVSVSLALLVVSTVLAGFKKTKNN